MSNPNPHKKRNKTTGQYAATHGFYSHKWYQIWRGMVDRCENPKHVSFPIYGGRGIFVCEQWKKSPKMFIEWLEENGYKKGLQLDRIDNNGNYEPLNCRIVTRKENCRNRRDNRRYLVHGEMLMACEVEEKYGIKTGTFFARVNYFDQTPDEALVNKRKLPVYEWEIDSKMMSSEDIEWEFGVSRSTFNSRLARGWDANRAAKSPIRRLIRVLHC